MTSKYVDERIKALAQRTEKVMSNKRCCITSVTPQEPRWISCSERLPKAGEYIGNVARYYLVQNEYGDMLVARYTHSEYWEQIYQLKPITDEIVAWMPLPAPFEPQESEMKNES